VGTGGQRRAPAALPTGKRMVTHFTERWVGPRTGLERNKVLLKTQLSKIREEGNPTGKYSVCLYVNVLLQLKEWRSFMICTPHQI
jgi:hypothetical protein